MNGSVAFYYLAAEPFTFYITYYMPSTKNGGLRYRMTTEFHRIVDSASTKVASLVMLCKLFEPLGALLQVLCYT